MRVKGLKVLIVGAGYVGVSIGAVLSKVHKINLLDVDPVKVDTINAGRSPVYEQGLDELLSKAILETRLKAYLPGSTLESCDVIIICVGTPAATDGSTNFSYIEQAIDMIFDNIEELCEDYCVLCMKSTVPPGTTRKLILNRVKNEGLSKRIGVLFSPEFLSEGTAVYNAMNPDRIIIGGTDNKASSILREMYEACLGKDNTIYAEMSLESAEICKYVSNCFLATKISFANEIANYVERISSADYDDVMYGVGLDQRISPSFFGSGAGYGGSCLPKDISSLIHVAKNELNEEPRILQAIQTVNSERPSRLVSMLLECSPDVEPRKISILGLAYKPNTADYRDSPSLKLIDIFHELKTEVWIHDPLMNCMHINDDILEKAKITDSLEDCLKNSDGCILVTNWDIYKKIGLEQLTRLMRNKIFIDGRRVFSKSNLPSDVIYRSVGVPPIRK